MFLAVSAPDDQPLPFLFEATNHEIRFRDERDPHSRSRYVFHFHRPDTLKAWLEEDRTLRARLHDLPALNTENLRNCQIDAIHGIEESLKAAKPRALLQMATGSGKTYTAVTEVYRLAKFAKITRSGPYLRGLVIPCGGSGSVLSTGHRLVDAAEDGG